MIKAILTFLLWFGTVGLYAQNAAPEEDFCIYNTEGIKALDSGDHIKALEYFTKAEIIAKDSGNTRNRLIAIVNIGKFYVDNHSFGDALKYYNIALNLIRNNPDLDKYSTVVLINIGSLYAGEGDYKMALEYNQKAYVKAKSLDNILSTVISAENISDCYNKLGDYPRARKYLYEIKNIQMDNPQRQAWKINYAESYLREGNYRAADNIMQGVLDSIDNISENEYYMGAVKLLSEINEAKGNLNKALFFTKTGLRKARYVPDKAELYKLIADLYYNNRQYENALLYQDSLLIAKDSITKSKNNSLYATNKVKLRIQDYLSEARYAREKHESERNLFVFLILLGTVLFYLICRYLGNRIIKQEQQRIIVENKQKIYELELNKLSNDVAEKNRKLSAKALYLSGRNELIKEVINTLDHMPEIQQENVQNHIENLRQHLKANEDWNDFVVYFEQVNPNFLKTLECRYPKLNIEDIRFICYIYMNLELKEISSILSITIEATRKRKQRIARKMDIDIDDLNEHITKLV